MILLISIVIPSFNKAAFIQQTLDSVKNQNFKQWEAIVVDDGSTDNSVDIIKNNCQKDSRIKLIERNTKPKGGSACRNIGIEKANGEYIMFLDADDILAPDCLNNRLKNINTVPNNDFWVFPTGTFYKKIGDSSSIWTPKGKDFISMFLSHDLPWNTMSVIWKKDFLSLLGGFDTDYPRLQDVELHTRALLKENVKYKVFSHEAPDCYYRIDGNRIIQNPYEFLKQWTKGVIIYTDKIGGILEKGSKKHLKLNKKLKRTAFSMLTTLLHRKATGVLKDEEYIALKNQLFSSTAIKKIYTSKDHYFLKLYEKAYQTGFYKIKGFNYLSKKCISF